MRKCFQRWPPRDFRSGELKFEDSKRRNQKIGASNAPRRDCQSSMQLKRVQRPYISDEKRNFGESVKLWET